MNNLQPTKIYKKTLNNKGFNTAFRTEGRQVAFGHNSFQRTGTITPKDAAAPYYHQPQSPRGSLLL